MFKSVLGAILLLAGIGVCAGNEIVADGQLRDGLAVEPSQWVTQNGLLAGGGTTRFLFTRTQFSPKEFTVDVELELAIRYGSAAGLLIGEQLFGFDGNPEKPYFYEGPNRPSQTFAAPSVPPANRLFHLRVTGKDGTAKIAVDGREVATVTYDVTKPLAFGLRPYRNTLRIKNFSVTGAPAGGPVGAAQIAQLSNLFLSRPTVPETLMIDRDQRIAPRFATEIAPGRYTGRLSALPTGDNPVKITCTAAADGSLTLSSAALTTVYRQAKPAHAVAPFQLQLEGQSSSPFVCTLLLCDPARTFDFPQCEVRKRPDGHNELTVDGQPLGSITARMARAYGAQFYGSAVADFGRAGINGNLVIVNPFQFAGKDQSFDLDAFLQDLTLFMNRTIAENPDATFMLYYQLMVPMEWGERHPDELIGLDTFGKVLQGAPGNRRQPSYASLLWRQEVGARLKKVVEALAGTPYADRIVSLRLLYANCGEWNHWGYRDNAFVDYSLPMQRAFGQWLQQKYHTVAALQQAWGRKDVTFISSDLVPSRADRMAGGPVFRLDGPGVRNTIDYYAFFQQYAAETIAYFARIAKDSSRHRLLIGSYYGYYFGHYGATPYHFQDSGNYGMYRLLQSPDLDFIGGPYPYEQRRMREEVNGIVGSVTLHGKVWESENDMRTHYSGKDNAQFGTTDNLAESIALAKRDYMLNLSRGSSYYFFDFVQNWYRDPEFMRTVAALKKLDAFVRQFPPPRPPQVAVIFSEKTIPYLTNQKVPRALAELRQAAQGGFFALTGAPYDSYLDSDLDRIHWTQYKVVIFANSYYADDSTIRLVREKVCRNGRSVLFLYAPGIIGADGKLSPERSRQLTGIGLTAAPDAEFTRINSSVGAYMLTPPIRFQTFIDDAGATPLATYPDGKIAGAVKKTPNGSVTVLCHPAPNAAWLRLWLKQQKVHLYPDGFKNYDCDYVAGPLLAVYSRTGGPRSFTLPGRVEIIADVFTGEVLGRRTDQFSCQLPAKTPFTRIFFAGPEKDWQQYCSLK